MSSSIVFTGSGFYLASANQQVPGTIRVRYSGQPKAFSALNVDDALNPSNYAIAGPGPAVISAINPVLGDPLSFDIVLTGLLAQGSWTVTVSNVQNLLNNPLVAPVAATFFVINSPQSGLTDGTEVDDAERIIRRHLNPSLKGDGWNALIAGLSRGDDDIWAYAQSAYDQLFLSTASGPYLAKRSSDVGITKPVGVGIEDSIFRKYAIKNHANKVVQEAIREILEAFYGVDSLRAYAETDLEETYNLSGSPTLTWTLDETQFFSYTFTSSHFASSTKARAIEVAVQLTKYMHDRGSTGFALAVQNAQSGKYRVRIYSGSLGLRSSVRVTGGTAQNQFHFDTYVEVYKAEIVSGLGYTWVVTNPDPDTTTFTLNTTGEAKVDLTKVEPGDYVLIGNDANQGAPGQYTVKAVSVTWTGKTTQHNSFSIEHVATSGSGLQLSNNAYRFFRPTRKTTNVGARTVVVSQSVDGRIDIKIPATTLAVGRGPKIAFYGNSNPDNKILALTRSDVGTVSVATQVAHGLNVGDHVIFDDLEPSQTHPYVHAFPRIPIVNNTGSPGLPQKTAVSTVDCYWTPVNSKNFFQNSPGAHAARFGTTDSWYIAGSGGIGAFVDDLGRDSVPLMAGTEADGQYPTNLQMLTDTTVPAGSASARYVSFGSKDILTVGGTGVVFDRAGNSNSVPDLPPDCELVVMGDGSAIGCGGSTGGGIAELACRRYITNGMTGAITTAVAPMNLGRLNFKGVALTPTKLLVCGGRLLGRDQTPWVAPGPFNFDGGNVLAVWGMDDATDATGNYNLTPVGAPAIVQGKFPNVAFNTALASEFSVGNYYTAAGDTAATDRMNSEWTIMYWFRGGDGTHFTYGGLGTGGPDENILFRFYTSGGNFGFQMQNGSNLDVTGTDTLRFQSSPWTHIAIRKRKSPNNANYDIDVFLNGLLASKFPNLVGSDGGANASWSIGFDPQQPSGPTNEYNGALDQIVVYKRAMNGAGIVADWEHTDGWSDPFSPSVGEITNRAEVYDMETDTWTEIAAMNMCRAYHEAFTLPDGRVLVVGGTGKGPSQLPEAFNGEAVVANGVSPNNALHSCEIYDPGSNTWQFTSPLNIARINPTGWHDTASNSIYMFGGYNLPNYNARPSTSRCEIFDIRTQTWRISAGTSTLVMEVPDKFSQASSGDLGDGSANIAVAPLSSGVVFISRDRNGTNNFGTGSFTDNLPTAPENVFADRLGSVHGQPFEVFIPASSSVSSGGIAGQLLRVTAVNSTTDFECQTLDSVEQIRALNVRGGDNGVGFNIYSSPISAYGSPIRISQVQRTGSIVTATVSHITSLKVGDLVMVNLNGTTNFPSGRKVITSIPTATTFTYTEGGLAGTETNLHGGVSVLFSEPTETAVAGRTKTVNEQGPFIFDPDGGLSFTGTEGFLYDTKLNKNSQYGDLELTVATGSFPESGYIIFNLGYVDQSRPIKYTTSYGTVPGRLKLVIDYTYRFEFDYLAGARITLMNSRDSFAPQSLVGSAYITGSVAGRTAAKAATEAALAAGIDPNISIVYPGDRGLGGEGNPTSFSEKLSDVVTVWAGDDTDEEVAEAKVGD